MRAKFSRLLTDAALADKRILLLTGDHGYALFDEFRSECADQFINCGIAEQNMVGVAAGLAKAGFRPIVYGLAAFVPMRVLEQIKMDVCYEQLPVMFIGDGAGVVYGQLGPSHQCTEDIAALRALPHLNILSPCDIFELEYCFRFMLNSGMPTYFRFGKADLGNVYESLPDIKPGNAVHVMGNNLNKVIFATGSMVSVCQKAAAQLGSISLYSLPVIVPVNERYILEIINEAETVFVAEEHSVNGGIGSMIAGIAAGIKRDKPVQVIRIGIKNRFSETCGTYQYLMEQHGLAEGDIVNIIRANS